MPTYEYRCTSCGTTMEVFASMSDPPPAACESCGAATLERVLHAPAIHYKGSGFYSTDYKGKRSKGGDSDSAGDAGAGGSDKKTSDGGGSSGGSGESSSSGGESSSSGGSGSSSGGDSSGSGGSSDGSGGSGGSSSSD